MHIEMNGDCDTPPEILAPVNTIDEVGPLLEALSFFGGPPPRCSLRWTPRRGDLRRLPEMLKTAARLRCGLTLPNRPAGVITTQGVRGFPDPGELDERMVLTLRDMCGLFPPGALRIHDFILAQAMGKKGAEPNGCEAGNSIAFIEEDGMVYPCESLRLPMGSLCGMEMEEIWSSPVRKNLLEDIRSVPDLCLSCVKLAFCRGGCRGAPYHLAGHFGLPDPLCPVSEEEPRE